MATENPVWEVGNLTAAADLRTKQYCFVKITAAKAVNVATAKGEGVLGVLQNKPNSGEAAEVMIIGRTKCIAGAAITAGAKVITDANAKGIATDAADQYINGWAEDAPAGANEIFTLIMPGQVATRSV